MQELASILLSHSLAIDDVLEQLTTPCILHDQVELLLSLYDLVKLYNRRVSDYLENVYLSRDPLNIMHINDLIFLEHLNCHLLLCQLMSSNHHFTKCTFAEISAKDVVAHNFTFLGVLLTFLLTFW